MLGGDCINTHAAFSVSLWNEIENLLQSALVVREVHGRLERNFLCQI